MVSGIHVWVGGVDVTTEVQGFSCDAIVNGGFSSAGFSIPIAQAAKLRHLMVVKCTFGHVVLWEGLLEDMDATSEFGRVRVTCFGWKRLLEQATIQRIWSLRQNNWTTPPVGDGVDICPANTCNYFPAKSRVNIGFIDGTNLSSVGVGFVGTAVSNATSDSNGVEFILPITANSPWTACHIYRVKGTITLTGAGTGVGKMKGFVSVSANGGTSWTTTFFTASGSIDIATECNRVRIGWKNDGVAFAPAATDSINFTNMRFIGGGLRNSGSNTELPEDDAVTNGGGFYGHTLVNDIVNIVPGIQGGMIDPQSSFVIPQLERTSRDSALSVLQEISNYYDVWWGIFENARLNWRPINRGAAPSFVIDVKDAISWEASRSIDRTAKTVYVRYTDATTGKSAEVSASTSVTNSPYSRWPYNKDVVINAGFAMTSNTATGLATAIGTILKEPLLRGSIVLPLQASSSGRKKTPYATIRPGDLVNIPSLPRLGEAQMGMNTVVVVATSIDIDAQTITLTLGDEQRTTDILTARLLAVTTALTGS